ncbi:MAG: YdcH family protein [Gammaproteobacteria bacterium]
MGRSDEKLIKHKIWGLEIQHRDLDQTVITLDASGNVDQLLLRRMKLRKLNLKDQITKLKSQLIPDLNA